MVFKRREKRTWGQSTRDLFWPRSGWGRSVSYIRHRLNRLPDQPHRIARGVFAGIFISFTPLYGIHLIGAALLARLLRGNVLASLFASLVGNPLTFPVIAVVAIKLGHLMLGQTADPMLADGLIQIFAEALADVRHNLIAAFTVEETHWAGMADFFRGIFWPYLLGGLLPGLASGLAGYYISLPLVTAYQTRRRQRMKERSAKLRAKRAQAAEAADHVPDNG
ncbi:hypothetical protein C8J30_11650 [Rhodobacter viridis]|uniref:DUF2062 domain-containing protein n=1 Tax=Rhodobacter viridis TaxID=1054202 RepID=A0A318TSU3_9RHOB|nr:DUF2062 domain-containing protein [Rhodobacter viridis]PYF07724.1 hypothetical protein C8J30_11650 [Rhodobacter viridis]